MKIEIIEREKGILAYIPESMRFFEINKKTKAIIEELNRNVSDREIMEKCAISSDDLVGLKEQLYKKKAGFEKNISRSEKSKCERKGLYKLVLNISNICNLRCRYCYANGGSYHSDEGIMSEKICKDTLDLFYNQFKTIDYIQLFGGEPLMNMPLIRYVCEYVRNNHKNTEIGMVTNGTLITQEFIELVKKYKISVTVSYDGIPLVNDIMRIAADGTGTSSIILSNIKQMYSQTRQPETIEVTYNQKHIDHNIMIGDVISFMRREVGDIPLHIVPSGGSKSCDYVLKDRQAFIQSIDDIFDNLHRVSMYTYSIAARIINNVLRKEYVDYLCYAGLTSLSVSINGDVYPCFMFTDDEQFCMGNIYDEDLFNQPNYKEIRRRLINYTKNSISKCKDCFIKNSCFGCLGLNFLETGSVFEISDDTCDMYRKMTEQAIYRIFLKQKEKEAYENAG